MAGAVVVDASLAVQWAIVEPLRPEARALLLAWDRDQVVRLVPSLFLSELNSPLLKLRRQGLITIEEAEQARDEVLAAVEVVNDSRELTRRALAIADGLSLRVAYDSLYAALAEAEGCELWTADERFYNTARARFAFVHWLGEIVEP